MVKDGDDEHGSKDDLEKCRINFSRDVALFIIY